MWPFRKPPVQTIGNPADYGANHAERPDEAVNHGRELAKLRNPDKRRSYKAFHDALAQQVGAPPIEWAD